MSNQITKADLVKASGYFLSTYHADLVYISRFKEWKGGSISDVEYHKEFYDFLKKYGVIRTVNGKGSVQPLLLKTKEWIDNPINVNDVDKLNDVDKFTGTLREPDITKNHIVSLASKVLFLNDPCRVFPMDSRAKNAINYSKNNYKQYSDELESFATKYNINKEIKDCLNRISSLVEIVEQDFKNKFKQIETIRNNRFKDTLLWTLGEKKTTADKAII
jgi:hypothetical protein